MRIEGVRERAVKDRQVIIFKDIYEQCEHRSKERYKK